MEKMRDPVAAGARTVEADDAAYKAVVGAVAAEGAAEDAMGFNGGTWYTEYRPQKNPWFARSGGGTSTSSGAGADTAGLRQGVAVWRPGLE